DQLLVTHGNYSCFLAITEYHQQAVDLFSPFNQEWCTYYLNSGTLILCPPSTRVFSDKQIAVSVCPFFIHFSFL
ncbi:MAG: hypothetical protein U9Q87_09895, partial [Pseudomonadota bacterium]|nr:hypothetical protein [Pseudomonadota bacterium]